jgi:hypothetical protein
MCKCSIDLNHWILIFPAVRNKAVADGAVSFYLDHFVGVRVSKHPYGIETNIRYVPSNIEHVRRMAQSYMSVSGEKRLDGRFSTILAKVIRGVPLALS